VLLSAFGSVQGVREASLEAISKVPGFSLASARKLHLALGVAVPEMQDTPPTKGTNESDPLVSSLTKATKESDPLVPPPTKESDPLMPPPTNDSEPLMS
jgi:hypothetical protein